MLDGVMLLWFALAALALLFVTIDIRSTPESPVLKWGFVLLTAYTGVFGAFLYVLGCREPLPGLHERYTAARWRQTLGSTMHCVAGDGLGILAGAVISSLVGLAGLAEVIVEYVLGFGFGWTIFQALFMRGSSGGSYRSALANTFVPELLSMNLLMAGMVPTVMKSHHPGSERSGDAAILVCHVDRTFGRFHRRLSDELVAGRQSSQARHDDRAAGREAWRCGRAWRPKRHDRRARWHGRYDPRRDRHVHEYRGADPSSGTGHDPADLPSARGRGGTSRFV